MADIAVLFRSLEIIKQYEPDAQMCAEHGEISIAGKSADNIPEQDRKELQKLGWAWDERYGCWTLFI